MKTNESECKALRPYVPPISDYWCSYLLFKPMFSFAPWGYAEQGAHKFRCITSFSTKYVQMLDIVFLFYFPSELSLPQ